MSEPDKELEKIRAERELSVTEEELQIKRADLQLRRDELELRRNQEKRWLVTSPVVLTILSGVLGLLAAAVVNVLQNEASLRLEREKFEATAALEREKFESSLLVKAMETGNPEAAAKNLVFLVRTGLVRDPSGKIAALEARPHDAPVLPSNGVPVPHSASARDVFFEGYRSAFGGLTGDAASALSDLFDLFAGDTTMTDIRQVAYLLATIKHETSGRYRPTSEQGADAMLESHYGGRRDLGNTERGDGSRFRGRGYIQIVGRQNYDRANRALRLSSTPDDLLVHPERALDPQIAFRILSYNMRVGGFTGRRLDHYISADTADYVNARRTVNGLDQAQPIAADAATFEEILRSSITAEQRPPAALTRR